MTESELMEAVELADRLTRAHRQGLVDADDDHGNALILKALRLFDGRMEFEEQQQKQEQQQHDRGTSSSSSGEGTLSQCRLAI